MTQPIPLLLCDWGVDVDYQSIHQKMRDYTDARDTRSPDQLWILEHKPVYTQGQAGKKEHIINPKQIPIIQSDRGGQVTYHGPGQIIIYLLVDIKRRHLGVRAFVSLIEQSIIALLQCYGISAYAKKEAPGVYVDGAKIGSVGLRIRKGCSYHGLSLNVDMDLAPFYGINPCGFKGLEMTQLNNLVKQTGHSSHSKKNNYLSPDMATVKAKLCEILNNSLQRQVTSVKRAELIV